MCVRCSQHIRKVQALTQTTWQTHPWLRLHRNLQKRGEWEGQCRRETVRRQDCQPAMTCQSGGNCSHCLPTGPDPRDWRGDRLLHPRILCTVGTQSKVLKDVRLILSWCAQTLEGESNTALLKILHNILYEHQPTILHFTTQCWCDRIKGTCIVVNWWQQVYQRNSLTTCIKLQDIHR